MKFRIYRYDPDKDSQPRMQDYDVEMQASDRMLLDALIRIKAVDDSLSLRRSCREGVCGSDAMNINGKNGLACITRLTDLKEPVELRPLPGLPVIRDLIVDMTQFFKQYHSVKPYLVRLLLDRVSLVLVESRQVRRSRRVAAGLSFSCRQPRRSHQRAPRQPRRSLPAVPLSLDHELRRRLSERAQSHARDRQDQGSDGQAGGVTSPCPKLTGSAGNAGADCWNWTWYWRNSWMVI